MGFVNLTTFEIPSLIWSAPILSASNHMKNAFEVSIRSTATTQLFLKSTFYEFNHPFTFAFQLLCTLALLLITHKIVYNIFFSPLRNIPGPFLAKITTKWLTLNEVAGNRSFVVAKAHENYGPIIRTGPDELSFSDRACIKEIYLQGSKFPKSRRYEGFASGTRASFDMTHPSEHRERRSLLRHVLAPSNVDEGEPLIGGAVRKSLRWVRRAQEGGESLDVMLWMRRIMLDTGGALFLGRDFGALENEEVPELLEWVDDLFAVFALNWFAPWIKTVLKYLPIPFVQFFLDSQRRCYAYGRKLFDEYIKQYGRYSGRIDLLTKMVGTPDSHPLSDEAICDELASLLLGAVDTTVVVATWMLWELAQHSEWQTKIREELRANTIEFQDGVPAYKNISSFPTLHGFIMESMRLHPAQSIGLPRVAGTDNTTIGGFAVPKGTSVSLQSRNVHRDPAIYPSPHSFHPERWISTNGGTKAMKDSFITFSKGSRACLGQYVAFMELKLVVASLINGWSVSVSEETTEKVMRQQDYFLAFPMERKCWLKFDRVKTSGDGGVVRLAPRIQ